MKHALIYLLILILADAGIGKGLEILYFRTMRGENGGLINCALNRRSKLIIMGSSRAKQHYVPEILFRKTALNCFNAGIDGRDIYYGIVLYDLIRKRFSPEVIIMDFDHNSLRENTFTRKRLDVFSYYLKESELARRLIFSASEYEKLKYLSSCYRANGKLLPILKNLFRPDNSEFDGFERRDEVMAEADIPKIPAYERKKDLDSLSGKDKTACFIEFLKKTEKDGVKVFLIHSPQLSDNEEEHTDWLNMVNSLISGFNHVRFKEINQITDPEFQNYQLYRDYNHLNYQGACIFSNKLSEYISSQLSFFLRNPSPAH